MSMSSRRLIVSLLANEEHSMPTSTDCFVHSGAVDTGDSWTDALISLIELVAMPCEYFDGNTALCDVGYRLFTPLKNVTSYVNRCIRLGVLWALRSVLRWPSGQQQAEDV